MPCDRNRRRWTRVVTFAAVIFAGCASSSGYPSAAAVGPPSSLDDPFAAGQVTVGLRVALDPEPDSEGRVRLAAVVSDAEGHHAVTDLGVFEGTVSQRAPVGNELIHITVGDDENVDTIRFLHRPGGMVEVRRIGSSETPADSELIRWIPVPAEADVHVSDPPIERRP